MAASEQGATQSGHFVRANGLDIFYTERGQGEPLLLIHGGILAGDSWQPYLDGFAAHFRVIMPDSRGHGRTLNPDGDLSFALLAEDMAAFIMALGLDKPLIFGYSDGGQIALDLAMRYPDIARALVIGGAHFELTEGSRVWVRSILGDAASPEVDTELFARENPDFAAFLEETHGAGHWQTLLKQIKPMWNALLNYETADFARVVAPTLVVLGDRDDFVPVEDGAALYRALPNAELAVVPRASHTDMIDTDRVAVAQAIVFDFLRRHAPHP